MSAAVAAPVVDAVWAALATVRDPELDEPVTSLQFVASCTVSADGAAEVHLRLPTYFCAPNFAFLMVADAYDAVSVVDGVRMATIVLDDHFASDQINGGIAARAGFADTFGDLAAGELDELRRDFLRRAVYAGTDRVARPLRVGETALLDLTLGDVPSSPDLDRLRERRAELGLAADDAAALLIDPASGDRIGAGDVRTHLGRARLSRVNIEANGSMCRGMLQSRYALADSGSEQEMT